MLNTGCFSATNLSDMKYFITLVLMLFFTSIDAENTESKKLIVSYNAEALCEISKDGKVPLWFTANRFGVTAVKENQFLLRSGLQLHKTFKHKWELKTGVELIGRTEPSSKFLVHQAYFDIGRKHVSLSIGAKEQLDLPLDKNRYLTSGWMVEGFNTRPIPQIRFGINDYIPFAFLKNWFSIKGHLAYGWFTDGKWQEEFVGNDHDFVKDVLYHSKSLMFRLGNKEKFPLDFEFGLHMAGQFGGDLYHKDSEGNTNLVLNLPKGIKSYWKAFLPQSSDNNSLLGEQLNYEGNVMGSWNFALKFYQNKWKARIYLEHYFEDSSQILWEYGPWKDGQLGVEITLPENKIISSILWEGMSTKDQTSSVFVRDKEGPFFDISMRGNDNYYNNYIYQAWQSYGLGMGNPLVPGPIYKNDGSLNFCSNRVVAHHLGIQGNPSHSVNWRILTSYAKHWGTYMNPLDKMREQLSFLLEINYLPAWAKGWKLGYSFGKDGGNYLGKSVGSMLTLCKKGDFSL